MANPIRGIQLKKAPALKLIFFFQKILPFFQAQIQKK